VFLSVFVFFVGRGLAIDRSPVGFAPRRRSSSIYPLSKESYGTPKNKDPESRRMDVGPHWSAVSLKKKCSYLLIN
jgi:hypothetical protein